MLASFDRRTSQVPTAQARQVIAKGSKKNWPEARQLRPQRGKLTQKASRTIGQMLASSDRRILQVPTAQARQVNPKGFKNNRPDTRQLRPQNFASSNGTGEASYPKRLQEQLARCSPAPIAGHCKSKRHMRGKLSQKASRMLASSDRRASQVPAAQARQVNPKGFENNGQMLASSYRRTLRVPTAQARQVTPRCFKNKWPNARQLRPQDSRSPNGTGEAK